MSSWNANGTATNALATATKAADVKNRLRLRGVSASYGTVGIIGLLEVKVNAVVVWSGSIHESRDIPIRYLSNGNENISAELAAGGVANVGHVTIWGDENKV